MSRTGGFTTGGDFGECHEASALLQEDRLTFKNIDSFLPLLIRDIKFVIRQLWLSDPNIVRGRLSVTMESSVTII